MRKPEKKKGGNVGELSHFDSFLWFGKSFLFTDTTFAGERKTIDSESPITEQTSGVLLHTWKRRQIDGDTATKLLPLRMNSIDQKYDSWNVPYDGCCYNGGICFTTDRLHGEDPFLCDIILSICCLR
ncbi:protocadherin Fat 4 [Nephila pilipes]|uniref:Protocadherin Fat 4 n=1 Tax=Nephila pilipes TaxID=299642 RepID=A0A8X6UQ17_NEPPI|nr:protocadherin Fat 4 [Nephila pilipes]